MQRLVPLIAAAALALALWQALEAQGLRSQIEELRGETGALRATLAELERPGRATDAADPLAAARPPLARGASGEGTSGRIDEGPQLVGSAASPEVLARTVQALEERLAAQEERFEAVEARVEKAESQRPALRMPRFFRSVEDAAGPLALTDRQRAEMERLVDRANEDLERLYEIPNAEGKTLADVNRPVKLGGEDEGIGVLFQNLGAVTAFKRSEVPGTGETYAEAEARIQNDAKTRIRDLLEPAQQKTWDAARPEGLFHSPGGGAISISTVVASPASAER